MTLKVTAHGFQLNFKHIHLSVTLNSYIKRYDIPYFCIRYIRNRKEAQEKEEREKAEAFDPNCPEGHVSLPDNERKETLRMLKKSVYSWSQYLL